MNFNMFDNFVIFAVLLVILIVKLKYKIYQTISSYARQERRD